MITMKCDRCGKEEELSCTFPSIFERSDGSPKFVISYSSDGNAPKMINLCSSCEKLLEEFLNIQEIK